LSFFAAYRALLCVGFAAAFRRAEFTLPAGESFSTNYLLRAWVSWRIDGALVAHPTLEQLANLAVDDYCTIKPPICKNDPCGLNLSWKPSWLLPFSGSAICADTAMAALIRVIPIAASDAQNMLLFAVNDTGSPMRPGVTDSMLASLLRAAFAG
jgi:hypothetical protein